MVTGSPCTRLAFNWLYRMQLSLVLSMKFEVPTYNTFRVFQHNACDNFIMLSQFGFTAIYIEKWNSMGLVHKKALENLNNIYPCYLIYCRKLSHNKMSSFVYTQFQHQHIYLRIHSDRMSLRTGPCLFQFHIHHDFEMIFVQSGDI